MADDELLVRAAIRDEISGPLEKIREELARTGKSATDAGAKANIGARGFDKMAAGAGRLAKFAGRTLAVGVGIGGTALLAAGAAAATMGIRTASAMQTAKIGFTTMLGSAKEANKFLRDLANFAATTPFEFPELQTAASSLVSAGIETAKIIPIMTTLGDVTAGVGTGSEGVQRATIALQQMSAAGKITGEDLNQLRDAGIPVFDLLSAAMGRTKAEIADMAQKGTLGAEGFTAMMTALETGKGLERFSGLMEKQSQTLSGVWSTLSDTVNMGLASAFLPAIPVLTKLTLKASDLAQKAMPSIQKFVGTAVSTGVRLTKAFQTNGIDGVAKTIEKRFGVDATGALDKVKGIIADVSAVLTGSLMPAVNDVAGAIDPGWLTPLGAARAALGFLADHTTTTHVAITTLVAVLSVAKVATMAYAAAQGVLAAKEAISLMWLKLHTVGTIENTVASKAAAVASKVWAAGQWLLNAALTANPIGLVVVAIAALVGGLIFAYKKSETFRNIVDGAFRGIAKAADWMWNGVIKPVFKMWVDVWFAVVGAIVNGAAKAFGWVPGLGGKLQAAADKFNSFKESVNRALDGIEDKTVTIRYQTSGPGAGVTPANKYATGMGDTATSRAHGGNLASTMSAHARAVAATGARPTITNALIGGGGRGRGSGDHQAGRALDLQGKGLARYGQHIRAEGGYAAFHGSGPGRHLHAVPAAMGDTVHSRARSRAGGAAGGSGGLTIEAGAVTVTVENPSSDVDVARAVAQGIRDYVRDREERA